MSNFFLKPTDPDVKVRDPVTKEHLPESGQEKPRNSYWLRRIKDGDVMEARPPAPQKKSSQKEGDK